MTVISPGLALALHHLIHCAMEDKPCAALLTELRRLYTLAGEPLPDPIRTSQVRPSGQYRLLDGGYTVVPLYEILHDAPEESVSFGSDP